MNRNFNSCNDPALWGGIECTINRVGEEFRDQLELTGHYNRPDDIEHFGSLGVTKMRYPVLWERHAPVKYQKINWEFTARNLDKLLDQNIEPIAGLVHHGSGPRYTNLLDPDFGAHLAEYAFEVSRRFPFLKEFTPVNEPLTTARFSGLYGFWYPHITDDRSFVQMLLNQLKAIVLSMQAIRSVNPGAGLLQTEDLGKTHSTPQLAYQADFDNHRRWLTYDILCGRLRPGHPLWTWFTESLQVKEADLQFFLDNPCSPDVLGLNYYVTSERWLDEKLDSYPPSTHGGNQFQRFADTEVVRSRPDLRFGIKRLGEEAWNRYKIPLAITEVHLHCTREEQMRWFAEIWKESCRLTQQGVPVKGVTVWSMIGAYDWDSLLTRPAGHYEPGAFIAQSRWFRTSALGELVRGLARHDMTRHPLLNIKGWWHGPQPLPRVNRDPVLLISGPEGETGELLHMICRMRGIPVFHDQSAEDCTNPFALPGVDPQFWEMLRYDADPARHFYSTKMECLASIDTPLDKVVHQVLDLLIDGVEGMWHLDAMGIPVPAPSTSFAEP